ncbi:MAG: energy-dependent translational throttle protein EttA [Planctomycetes bacterium]|nr:energy-dependent translational throttle protein EttA [Planctomycetota bacterium]
MKGLKPGQPLYTLKNVRRKFGDRQILRDVTFSIYPKDRIGIVGVNGSGKSTLMKILAGGDTDFEGIVAPAKGLTVGYVPQEPDLDPDKTVRENVEEAVADTRALLARMDEIYALYGEPEYLEDEAKMNALMEEQGEVQTTLEDRGVTDASILDNKIEMAMEALRLPPGDRLARVLSGGEKRRVSLVRALLAHPDLLILDEPTNHLDAETIVWLENFLADYTGTYILVTHDRYFLDRVANRMLEVDHGEIRSYQGNYSDFLEQKQKQKEVRDKTDANLLKALERELEWIRSTPAARRKKSKARISAFDKLVEEAEAIDRPLELELVLPFGPRLGGKVINVEHLTKGYGDKVLFKDLSFEIPPGAILGVTGANGLGKTTLIKIILGLEQPDGGRVDIGQTTKLCYVDQTRDTLDPNKTVYEEVSQGSEFVTIGAKQLSVRHYLARFLFTGPIQQTPVGKLSGGERNRVQLAKFLREPSNVIILDEPTNDLDLMTLRVLEEALTTFPGSAIVITHDRYFLDRVATHILAFEGRQPAGPDGPDGGGEPSVYYCFGSWETYAERKAERDAEAGRSDPSQKFKHRKIAQAK